MPSTPPASRSRTRLPARRSPGTGSESFSAAANLKETGFRITDTWNPTDGLNIASDGVGLARRTNAVPNPTTPAVSANFNLSGIPAGARVRRAYVVYQTIGGPDPNFIFNGSARTATLIGGSGQFTCWNTNNGGAFRTYRYIVPQGQVTGNGSYNIRGVGGTNSATAGRADGQGASLVVVYDRPSATRRGRAYLRWGSFTARPGASAASHTFTGLTVPNTIFTPALHVGIGDGEPFADPAMRFNAQPRDCGQLLVGLGGELLGRQPAHAPGRLAAGRHDLAHEQPGGHRRVPHLGLRGAHLPAELASRADPPSPYPSASLSTTWRAVSGSTSVNLR